MSGPIDVHVISEPPGEQSGRHLPRPPARVAISRRRQGSAWALAVVGLPLLTVALTNLRGHITLAGALLLYLMLVLAVAAIGGTYPAIAAAIAAFFLANWFFADPLYELTISESENVIAMVVFVIAAVLVSALVDRTARSRLEAARATAEAEALAALAGSLAEKEALPRLVGHLRTTFDMQSAAVFRRDQDGWGLEASAGTPISQPDGATVVKDLGRDLVLAMNGRKLGADDHRVLGALAGQLSTAIETHRLQDEAAPPARSPGPTTSAPRYSKPCRTICGLPWPRSRRRSAAFDNTTSTGRRSRATSSKRRSSRPPTASMRSSPSCST